ncbi:response regulator [Anaerobaca lacustris]|uniref:response regulator n=1 Tax=Anaerobaca lacustris TaxID=3044600 RepID=UPI003D7694D8
MAHGWQPEGCLGRSSKCLKQRSRRHWVHRGTRVLAGQEAVRTWLRVSDMPSDRVSAIHDREAVDLPTGLEPDAVIVDVVMPLIDGNTARRRIQERSSKIRVIALASYNEPGIIEKMYRAEPRVTCSRSPPPQNSRPWPR